MSDVILAQEPLALRAGRALDHARRHGPLRKVVICLVSRSTPSCTCGLFRHVGVPVLLRSVRGCDGTLVEADARIDRALDTTVAAHHRPGHAGVGVLVAAFARGARQARCDDRAPMVVLPPPLPDAPGAPDASLRAKFLLDPNLVFLNHGSSGACPRPVLAAQQRWQREMERNPVEFLGRRSAALLGAARERLAAALGARAEDLVFVPNATTGVNAVARSLLLEPGDEVLATDHEYGACDAAWAHACRQRGAHYRRVTVPLPFDATSFVDRLLDAATPRTRAVFASHVTSTTALVFPVAELCRRARERGITSVVDGAHAPGQLALDLDAIGADCYAGNCHKWLCAPKGSAFLHARAEAQAVLDAPVVSWGYVAEELAGAEGAVGGHTGLDAYTGRTRFERRLQWQGTRDITPWLAVPAALDFLDAHDWPAQRARCHASAIALMHRVLARNGLAPIAPDDRFAQMVPIAVRADDPEALRRRLFEQHRIEVPVTTHGARRFVRVSVQAYNDEGDLRALEAALAAEGV